MSIREPRPADTIGTSRVREHLIVTRYSPKRVGKGEMLSLDDIGEILGIPLLGVIPESPAVLAASNAGTPVILEQTSDAAQAYADTVARFLGAAVAIFTVTEASLEALEGWRTPLQALSKAVLVLLAGGLAIAAFFGVPEYMLRLRTFSGVKATLLVPPLLVLLHDLRRRVHPESLGRVLSRPPLWGELVLLGGFFLGMVVLAVRSDNVSLAPQWEMALRNSLEQILVARPRNKEVFLGYPALVLWFFVRRMDLVPRYREVLRLCAVFAFASALNSFCHFHTPLYFTLWRVVNGLLGGLLAGLILAVIFRWIVLPLWRRLVPALTA